MKVLLRLVPLALVCAVASSCSTFSVAAATVNGQRITQAEVQQQLAVLDSDPNFGDALRQDPNVARGNGRRQVLTTLIYTAIAQQEAKKLNIRITDAQISRLISERASSDGLSVSQFLKLQKLTLAQGRDIARRLLLDFSLQQRVLHNTQVSAASIRQAYEQNKASFAQAHLLRMTVGSSSEVRDALQKINSGTDFSALAKQSSIDQLGGAGGDMGYVLVSQLSPQEQDAITRAKLGGVTDPVPTQSAFEIFKVVDRRTQPLADATAGIQSGLAQQQRTQDYQTWLVARVRHARIVVNPEYGQFDPTQAQVVQFPTSLRP